jgi:TetR/AcrR family acrAB operon transcriptional repressor
MARKTKEESLKTRQAILSAAAELFYAQGVHPTTLAKIADAAGMTRGAIYWHFKNKADLLRELWDELICPQESVAKFADILTSTDPLGDLERAHICRFKALIADPRRLQLLKLLEGHGGHLHEDADLMMLNEHRNSKSHQRLGAVLQSATRQGQLPDNCDIRLATIVMLSFFDGLINSWLKSPEVFQVEQDIPVLFRSLTQMLQHLPTKID